MQITRKIHWLYFVLMGTLVAGCGSNVLEMQIVETAANGNHLQKIEATGSPATKQNNILIELHPEKSYQTIQGIGGSFTESTAYLLKQLSPANREKVIEAYFGESGAKYSLTRTHIASCDFSLNNYTYAPVVEDTLLKHFSVQEDLDDLIPLIKDAMKVSKEGFKIVASPWTAPPWMKDNKSYVGGKLLPRYYATYANYFAKYLQAYAKLDIPIWAITPVNEPHGNGNSWESMHFSPQEMTNLVQYHLGPTLEKKGLGEVHILGYDQNREGLKEWVDVMYANQASSKYFSGTAVHWYESTYDYFPKALDYAKKKAKDKLLIQTEGCVDSEVPHWKDDAWYWRKEATDWGWDWAAEDRKYLHPKYVPVYRYARDIIGCLNHGVDGWIDWNMVLDRQGGPNWFKNWCVAPVLVDPEIDEVYFTPLYYTLAHFSRYIRPGAKRIKFSLKQADGVMATAVENPNKELVVVLFNPTEQKKNIQIKLKNKKNYVALNAQALQTLVIKNYL